MIAENNATLPILSHVDEITNSVTCNQVTIIVGDTGSGKSTQTPQILRAAGYGKIVMALPRRLITKTLARRLAAEMQVELGTVVGYKLGNTGNGIHDRLYNMDTDVLLMTNALLVDHIQSSQESEVVYIIDELHEWDLDVEVAVGLIKRKLAEFPELRLVLMSATIEAERLSKFFDDAPIINVDGQMYPVEDREPSGDCHQCIMSLFNEGRDILVFLDGEREINACIEQLESLKINAELIPLHAKLDPEQQDRALRIYDRQKIVVATNVAESSLTVPGITGVVDGGKKKIKVVLNGVDCLMSVIISKAEAEQRRGRAGRCGPGVYINLARGYQDEYPMPEIQRLRLDKSILQLLVREVEIEDLELFHQPPFGQISEAKRVLKLLGCINQESKVTEDGRQVAELPLGVHTGRMVVEAIKCGVLADVMTIAAILENESFLHRENDAWRRLIGNERDSELLAMLTVFKQLKDVRQHEEFEKLGIVTSSLIRVKECRSRLFQHLKNEHRIDSSGDREAILKCIAVGMLDRLFVKAPRNLIAADCSTRLPNRSGIVFANTGDVILGVPRDIIYKDKKYGDDRTLPIVTFMTKVSFDVIMSLVDDVTQLGFSKSRDEEPIYDPEKDAVVTTNEVYFHDIPIKSMIGEKCTGEIANRIFKNALAEILSGISTVPQNLQEVVRTINERNRRCRTIKTENPKFRYREWDYSFFESWLIDKVRGVSSLQEITDLNSLLPVESLDSMVEEHLRSFPEEIRVEGIGAKKVDYTVGIPTIQIEGDEWKHLPDEALKLPNGHQIGVDICMFGDRIVTRETNYKRAKDYASDAFIRNQEKEFKLRNELPRQINLRDVVVDYPVVREAVFALHPTMGHSLELYGVLSRAPSSDRFTYKWYIDPDEAERMREEQISSLRADYFRSLTKFSISRSRIGQNKLSDAWVIRENGSPRACDSLDDGIMTWYQLAPSELVLSWTCADKSDPESHIFTVIQYPIAELTENQVSAVKRIEKEIKCPQGRFLIPELNSSIFDAISKSFSTCPLSGKKVSWVKTDLLRLASLSGKILGSGPEVQEYGMSIMSDTSAYGCPASILDEHVVNNVTFELITFELDKVWYLAIRVKA